MTTKTRRPAAPPPAKAAAQEPLFINFAVREGAAPRRMNVRIPTHEQLAVWQSIGETFTRLGAEWEHQSAAIADLAVDHPDAVMVRTTQNRQAVRGVNRSLKLVKSVLVDEADHEWVDDMVMEGATMEQMLGIVSHAVDAMRERAKANTTSASASAPKTKAELTE